MALSVTALELVNRVLRRMRLQTVSNLNSEEATVVLDFVNAAKEDVLTSRDWSEDIRHDGVLITIAPTTSTTLTLTQNSSLGSDSALTGKVVPVEDAPPTYAGNQITRFEYQGDANTSGESGLIGSLWRVNYLIDVTPATVSLDATWPGTSTSTAKAKYFVAEYLLPDTVREITSITNQNGTPLQLEHVDPRATFDQLFPDLSERYGPPEWAGAGGYETNTYDQLTSGSADGGIKDPRLRLVLFPVPDDIYRFSYSYYYNHPDLESATDTLRGVKPELVSSIVEKATADAIQVLEQRVEDGTILSRTAENRVRMKHLSSGAQPARRQVVGSWNGHGSRRDVRNGFPGVTITE